jgi:hypothetical protein
MGRTVATVWHVTFSVGAGVLYFFFVLPRWPELMGDTPHVLGTTLRIVAGVLIGLTALPVVFASQEAHKPEYATPRLALTLRTWSIVAAVLAGTLIVGAAIGEIWLNLDVAGRYLFGVYAATAAVWVLGLSAFYLSFVAERPAPPPKPPKPPKPKKPKRRLRRKRAQDDGVLDGEEAGELGGEVSDQEVSALEGSADEGEEVSAEDAEPAEDGDPPKAEEEPAIPETLPADTEAKRPTKGGLQNRRPSGKAARRRRRSTASQPAD